jgi:hypothetical protein
MSYRDKQKSRSIKKRLMSVAGENYLQLAQVHVEPQLQLTHVQLGLLHFTF